jgi:peptidoglycan/LPS O-acetylase OafA/YrhL
MALLLLPALDRESLVFPFNGPQCSLLLEQIANAVHATILVRFRRTALLVMIGLAGAALATAIILQGANDFGANGDGWWLGIPRVLFSYGLGLFLARERQAGGLFGRLQCRWTVAVMLPVLAVVGLPLLPLPSAVADLAITLVVIPACFTFAVNAELPERYEPVFSGLGLLSYPLYATHLPILTVVSMNAPHELGAWIGPALTLFAAAGIAHLLEVPRRQSRSRRRARMEPDPLNT